MIAVDPGREFGAALYLDGELRRAMHGDIGVLDDLHQFTAMVNDGECMSDAGLHCIHERGGWRGKSNAHGLGRNLGYLLGWARMSPRWNITHVSPLGWRKALFGTGKADKQTAIDFAGVAEHNEAEAICIGAYRCGWRP